jgi:hypothetical protein
MAKQARSSSIPAPSPSREPFGCCEAPPSTSKAPQRSLRAPQSWFKAPKRCFGLPQRCSVQAFCKSQAPRRCSFQALCKLRTPTRLFSSGLRLVHTAGTSRIGRRKAVELVEEGNSMFATDSQRRAYRMDTRHLPRHDRGDRTAQQRHQRDEPPTFARPRHPRRTQTAHPKFHQRFHAGLESEFGKTFSPNDEHRISFAALCASAPLR